MLGVIPDTVNRTDTGATPDIGVADSRGASVAGVDATTLTVWLAVDAPATVAIAVSTLVSGATGI